LITILPLAVVIVTVRVWPAGRAGGWLIGHEPVAEEPVADDAAGAGPIGSPPPAHAAAQGEAGGQGHGQAQWATRSGRVARAD
jgi:hypothetical protein